MVLYRVREYTDRPEMNVSLPRASEKERVSGGSKRMTVASRRQRASLHTKRYTLDQDMRRREEKTREGKVDGVILSPTGSNGTALSDMKMKPPLRAKGRWFALVGALKH